jgi:hypothetical protein
MIDPLTRLSELPSAEPTPERATRLRRRCREQLARQGRRPDRRTTEPSRPGGPPLWHAAIAGLCVAYMAEAVVLAVGVLAR